MPDARLQELARLAGLATEWVDYRGETRIVAPETLAAILAALDLPAHNSSDIERSIEAIRRAENLPSLVTGLAATTIRLPLACTGATLVLENGAMGEPKLETAGGEMLLTLPDEPGYHSLEIGNTRIVLAICPEKAWGVADAVGDAPIWGSAAQIYSLNDGRKGFGDFADVAALAAALARHGADFLALSPAHALFSALPGNFGPYSPSTRLFLNPLYIPVDGETAATPDLIDWPAAATSKMAQLRQDYAAFTETGTGRAAFDRFVAEGGDDLLAHARFEIQQQKLLAGSGADWRNWPDPHRVYDAGGAGWRGAAENEVGFHLYLQWRADDALAGAQADAMAAGMRIGLITDMAVGVDPAGSQGWGGGADLLSGITIGAPPDMLNEIGQSWGLATLSPRALRQSAFRPFLATLRRAMRHAGGVRIDHALGLQRLWVVPPGAAPTEGTYLANPFQDLLRLICLESRRHRAIVIGEDLGNVPPGFQETLARHNILGMRPLWFEHDATGNVKAAEAWDREAVALTTTHDLPSVAGWWSGNDLAWRRRLFPGLDIDAAEMSREDERARLWRAIGEGAAAPTAEDTEPAVDAAIAFVARAASRVALIPMEDIVGTREQPNVPGTIDTHPNWRRRLPAGNGLDRPAVTRRLNALSRLRPRA